MARLNALALSAEGARQIEQLAMRAWPARVVQPLHGWRLAFSDGLTRRINSVQACDWEGREEPDRAIEQVERFYAGRGLPARFRLTALSRPEGLDAHLEARGYAVEAATDVLVADVVPGARAGHDIVLAPAPPDDWLTLWLAGLSPEEMDKRRSLLGRLPPGAVFALARTADAAAGIALAVVEDGWAGIFAMQTAEHCRGRGVAATLLDRLAARVQEMGATRLYLQVEQDNPAAQRLYQRAGFRFGYSYHYRTRCALRHPPAQAIAKTAK